MFNWLMGHSGLWPGWRGRHPAVLWLSKEALRSLEQAEVRTISEENCSLSLSTPSALVIMSSCYRSNTVAY